MLAPNPLVTALVASEVFLLGFLLNRVLMDYKEGEKTRSVRTRHPEAKVRDAFVPSVYGMAYIGTGLLTGGSCSPFAAAQATSVENVSLLPLDLAVDRLRRVVEAD